jgi:phosphatidylinositol alpha-1,6-mannosyltransferase
VPSLLVTNDFPPKLGGIQSYLYELWRRLPGPETTVLTTPHRGAAEWDAQQSFRVERTRDPVLLPRPGLARDIDALAREVGADVIFLDPMLPLGLVAPRLRAAPVVVITHGSEVTVPARLPGSRALARRVLDASAGIVAAGTYPAREAQRVASPGLRGLIVPPGVDVARFTSARAPGEAPRDPSARPVVLGLSRLVPRKGFDVLLEAAAGLECDVVIGGAGRDRRRLERLGTELGFGDRLRFPGRVPDADLPAVYRSADVFAMLCRDRWGGLEAEGFGIVFLEAAACGVPAVAGRSGGSHEAVVDGETGFVVEPRDVDAVRAAIGGLLDDRVRRDALGAAARARAAAEFAYEHLVSRLLPLARGDLASLTVLASMIDPDPA